MLTLREGRYMKYLKIEGNIGSFYDSNSTWKSVSEITAEDLLFLANKAVEEDSFECDDFRADELPNPAQRIIYQKVSEQLNYLHNRRESFIDETRSIYKEAYLKYCAE